MIDNKKKLVRKTKSKFIHKSDDWSHCYITKAKDSTVYLKKINSDSNSHAKIKSYLSEDSAIAANIPIFLNHKIIEFIPRQLSNLFHSIEKSKYLLELQEDWDGEGAEAYDVDVWKKSVLYISKFSTKVFKTTGQIIPAPKIFHGPNGSVDMYWESNVFNLLLNFPKNGVGTFYGDDYGSNKSEGFFDITSVNLNIFPFLLELK